MKRLLIYSLIILTSNCHTKTTDLENRSIDSYLEQIEELEFIELKKRGILLDTLTIADEYLDKDTNRLSEQGYMQYIEVKAKIYKDFFKDYLFLQKIEYQSNVYVLYCSVAGFDDIEWHVVKWSKSIWNNSDRLSEKELQSQEQIQEIFWNYDEGPKNMENVRIFQSNNFLVLERSGLFHSLYNMESEKLIINEVSPFFVSESSNIDSMNNWIRINLHDRIEKVLDL